MVSLQNAEEIIWQKIKTLMITQAQRKGDYLEKKKKKPLELFST